MNTDELNPSAKQKKIAFAQSEHAGILNAILQDCLTPMPSIVAKDEFHTMVNALTIEIEGKFKAKVLTYLEEIRKGGLHGK